MAVVVLCGDLLFGSRLAAMLAADDPRLVGDADAARAALADGDVLVVDLTSGDIDPGELLKRVGGAPRTLGFYSHVEPEVRERALAAGFDQVVPRSRMAREGAQLVARLREG